MPYFFAAERTDCPPDTAPMNWFFLSFSSCTRAVFGGLISRRQIGLSLNYKHNYNYQPSQRDTNSHVCPVTFCHTEYPLCVCTVLGFSTCRKLAVKLKILHCACTLSYYILFSDFFFSCAWGMLKYL